MAEWDADENGDDDFELEPSEGWDAWELPQSWEEWHDFDWESYDGEYEEYAVSAEYEG